MNKNIKKAIYSAIIVLGCFLPWVKMGLFSISGTNWEPAIVVLISGFIAGGIALYNHNQNKNLFPWASSAVGVLGLLVCAYAAYYGYDVQKSMNDLGNTFNSIDWDTFEQKTPEKSSFSFSVFSYIGIGYYLTLIGSVLLLFGTKTKKENNTIDYSEYTDQEPLESTAKKWLAENPGKTINDYYLQIKKQ